MPSRNWPYVPAMLPRFAAIVTPYRRKLVSVPMPNAPSITCLPVYQRSTAIAPKPRKVMSAPKTPRQSARREAVATIRRRSASYLPISQSSRTKLFTTRIPARASSAVVVLRAISSWTSVLTRWRGRPKRTATTMSAGARTRTRMSRVGERRKRMTTAPTSPIVADRRFVTVCVSIVRTCVTSLERRETSSPTRFCP